MTSLIAGSMIPPCQIPAVASAIECEKNDKTKEKAQQQTPPALHITFAGARAVAVLAVATGWKAFPVGTPLSLLTLAAVRAAAAKVVRKNQAALFIHSLNQACRLSAMLAEGPS